MSSPSVHETPHHIINASAEVVEWLVLGVVKQAYTYVLRVARHVNHLGYKQIQK